MCVLDPLPLYFGELVKVREADDGDGYGDGDDGLWERQEVAEHRLSWALRLKKLESPGLP